MLAREIHNRGLEIAGESIGLAQIGETPKRTKESLLCDVLCDLLIPDQEIGKPHRILCVSGIQLLHTEFPFVDYPPCCLQPGTS